MQRLTHAGLTMALAALMAAGLLAYAPATTEAVIKCVGISAVRFTPDGDPLMEWVRIKNRCRKSKNLSGWILHDWGRSRLNVRERSYRISRGTWVRPGATLTVYTGPGRDTRTKQYMDRTAQLWSYCSPRKVLQEIAYLRNRKGKLVDSRTPCRLIVDPSDPWPRAAR